MHKQKINIVWLKRDLRWSDHAPLKHAEAAELPTLVLYIFEPILLADPHYSERHWRFVTESLMDMNRHLSVKVSVAHGEVVSVLEEVSLGFDIQAIFSYEETGLANTFARDKRVSRWASKNSVTWQESSSDAVIRPCSNRQSWDQSWQKTMRADLIENQLDKLKLVQFKFATSHLPNSWKSADIAMQTGGATQARRVLDDFFEARGKDYHWFISKPLQSQLSCSRMSPYLA